MLRKRKSAALTLAAAALLSGAVPADAGQPGVIKWTSCIEEPLNDKLECGTLRLPIDWTKPSAGTFDLAVSRRKALVGSRRIGVLMINPGGPGDSGVDFARRATTYFSQEIQDRFDIVGFDPRGVKRSSRITCSPELLARQPSVYPRDQAEFDRIVAYNRELGEDCRQRSGPIFDHADALSIVQDMDALRRALGEKQISYFGHSYGTLFGQQYAERYGHRVRAMSISANMDHSLGTKEFLESSAATIEDSFTEFVKWCDRTPSCALHGQDVGAVWDRVLTKADRGEIGLKSNEVIAFAMRLLKNPQWSDLVGWVVKLDTQGSEPAPPSESMVPIILSAFCQDWQFRIRDHRELARLTDVEMKAAPHMRGSPAHPAAVGCVGLPPKANNPQHRLHITDAPKILVSNAVHDPVSAYEWARTVHRQAKKSTALLTYEGWGHQVYNRSVDCTRATIDSYLLELKVPSNGIRCPAV